MLFNSYNFALLLLIALIARNTPVSWVWRKLSLLGLSYLFYGAWYPVHLGILLGLTIIVWSLGEAIRRASSTALRRALLVASLIFTLLPLMFFKYSAFLLLNLRGMLGGETTQHLQHFTAPLLPIGISFYTFEAISYTVDTYQGRGPARTSFLDFALFLAFFPRMVAGPIMRANLFLPQCETPQRVDATRFAQGVALFIFGLFEKIVLADWTFAPAADQVFAFNAVNSTASTWVGTFAFAFQIFFDFAGYSTAAIGVARLLGFELPLNFNSPYSAVDFSDFWQRWHISLSSWLRDYLYIPLGGNRRGPVRTKINLLLTMLLGGLWHGAAWRFVVWGGLHGTYLIGQRVFQEYRGLNPSMPRRVPALGSVVGTFLLVCLGWIFFRATSLSHALSLCGHLVGVGSSSASPLEMPTMVWISALAVACFAAQWWSRGQSLDTVFARMPAAVRVTVLAVMLLVILFSPGDNRAFIYFQF